jgi:hypothetical protein
VFCNRQTACRVLVEAAWAYRLRARIYTQPDFKKHHHNDFIVMGKSL